ncbi:MAG: phosphohydrolase [Pseudonocardiaceae bacterium]|nr:phosphohydrolase [Pseudonocardiaceae bacterium]
MAHASFLELPDRTPKPRSTGLTHVIDPGVGPAAAADVLASGAQYIDIWKVGWGVAYLDGALETKLALLAEHGVSSCLGGTLLELAWAQGRAGECLQWAAATGFDHVEVSRGTVPMSLHDKRELIRLAARDFVVLAEVGTKSPDEALAARHWPAEASSDLDAGAQLVVTEGRQSGTVGTFTSSGRVRPDVVEAVVAAVGRDRVIFEAPRTAQQAWFVRRFGTGVNLGNVALSDVLGVETLRLGLRSDTAVWDGVLGNGEHGAVGSGPA